jgi:hypothetical protein
MSASPTKYTPAHRQVELLRCHHLKSDKIEGSMVSGINLQPPKQRHPLAFASPAAIAGIPCLDSLETTAVLLCRPKIEHTHTVHTVRQEGM